MQMKPHLQRRSDFIGNSPIAEHNDAGILVLRDGNEYRFAVELDVDTVVELEKTDNKDQVTYIIDSLRERLPEIRDQFGDCFTE